MPFVFGTFGILFIVAGVRGQTSNLFALIKSDFTGTPNYFEWMVAIFLVGSIGYVKELSTISRLFMFLVAAGLLYQNKQVFAQLLTQETTQPVASLPANPVPSSTVSTVAPLTQQTTATQVPQLPSLDSLPELDF